MTKLCFYFWIPALSYRNKVWQRPDGVIALKPHQKLPYPVPEGGDGEESSRPVCWSGLSICKAKRVTNRPSSIAKATRTLQPKAESRAVERPPRAGVPRILFLLGCCTGSLQQHWIHLLSQLRPRMLDLTACAGGGRGEGGGSFGYFGLFHNAGIREVVVPAFACRGRGPTLLRLRRSLSGTMDEMCSRKRAAPSLLR